MSARRPHFKSKLGCANCKQRRIKCDEGRPGCWNCHKRKLTCSFHTFDPVARSASAASATAAPNRIASHVNTFVLQQNSIPSSLPDQTLLDLLARNGSANQESAHEQAHSVKLLRHFATQTVRTTIFGAKAQTAWCGAIPQLAYHHNFVLHGVLSLASLHLSRLTVSAEEREHYQNKAAAQLNTGMTHYRTEIKKVTVKNAEALFAFSTVITGHSLLHARTDCDNLLRLMHATDCNPRHAQIVHSLSQTIVRVLQCLRGVLVILVPGWDQIHGGPLQPIIHRENWPPSNPETEEEREDDQKLRKLEQMWTSPEKGYEYYFDTLRQVLKNLRESFLLVSRVLREASSEDTSAETSFFDWTSAFHWPIQCPLDFLSLLDQRQMESWVLTAHYAMLLAKVKGLWWLDGLAANFAVTAALTIGKKNWDWIAWPLEFIGIDMEALRSLASIYENSRSVRLGDPPQSPAR